MKNIFIEYPKCSTCKKAKKWLEKNNIEFIDRNIVEETPTVEELIEWIQKSGKELKKWFNTSGLKYKELKVDVLKVSHHGSQSATSDELFKLIKPKIAFISVGKNNNPTTKLIQA